LAANGSCATIHHRGVAELERSLIVEPVKAAMDRAKLEARNGLPNHEPLGFDIGVPKLRRQQFRQDHSSIPDQ
jgi:hypothetical protein